MPQQDSSRDGTANLSLPAIDVKLDSKNEALRIVREYSIDLFAMLLPGFVFLIAFIFAFLIPLFELMAMVGHWLDSLSAQDRADWPQKFAKDYKYMDMVIEFAMAKSSISVYEFISFASLAYVVGACLFRIDPKVPDKASFIRIYVEKLTPIERFKYTILSIIPFRRHCVRLQRVTIKKNGECGTKGADSITTEPPISFLESFSFKNLPYAILYVYRQKKSIDEEQINTQKHSMPDGIIQFDGMVRPREKDEALQREQDEFLEQIEVQFPYSNVGDYLRERGFKKLAKHVEWNHESWNRKADRPQMRSKHFINHRKFNIEFYAPEHMARISKNEQEIRLASSSWFAGYYIRILAVLGLLMSSAALYISYKVYNITNFSLIAFPLSAMIVAQTLKIVIERSLHYQRTREVYYVLQLHYLLGLDDKDTGSE
jgi:hypothetical protein